MTDAAGALDAADSLPLAAAVARVDLEAARAMPADRSTALDDVRRIGRVLLLSAEKLGITQADNLDDLLHQLLTRARAGGLAPLAYRMIWMLANAPRCDGAAPSQEGR
jgi:hypothetical protein